MKRIAMPKRWPIARKGKPRFILVPRGSQANSLAVLVVLRDILRIAKTRKEAKFILKGGNAFINGKRVYADDFPLNIFDVLFVPAIGKHFILVVKGKRLSLKEISEKEASVKISKITGKKVLNNGKIQFNLFGGVNFIGDIEAKVGDSVLVDLKQNKIVKHLPLQEKARVVIIAGKNAGIEGIVTAIKGRELDVEINKTKLKISSERVWVVG